PYLKFERIIFTYLKNWPFGYFVFYKMLKIWLEQKIKIRPIIKKKLNYGGKIVFIKHHQSHASGSFFTSPFSDAAIITMDGVGEWATTTINKGSNNEIDLIKQINFPDSLGLLYSAFTYFLGFKVNDGEYKVMGLAPYGEFKYVDIIKKNLVKIFPDGSFKINQKYFEYNLGEAMIDIKKFEKLFGVKKREPSGEILKEHKDLAASIQKVLEEIIILICREAKKITGCKNLCLGGGVAMNCVANSKIIKSGIFENIFIFPGAGDEGGSVGAALFVWHGLLNNPKRNEGLSDVFWGPEYGNEEIEKFLIGANARYKKFSEKELVIKIANLIVEQKVIGWFQGRMEFGPRALGNRSILADPRNKENWQKVNLKIKFRESFRPFAPSILEEFTKEYFEFSQKSPFMLFTAKNKTVKFPATTHVDGTSRIQTVSNKENELFYKLIREFYKLTGVPVVLNTSFNASNMPIVCTPQNAYRCFLQTEIDVLVIGNFIIYKKP
ncbi:MAG: carbamoyltransferase C-terminal domain-containing protein, partial [Candidatus Subteraquimicrobiales bacterium]|nr:carbamoyltransferase C-terminal domain-containing protein [Candidatus Subteraquimicrobiales bacterium]